ncbi:MAG TPA: hypothetical protein ENN99_07245 [Chloroflexi bacterium]|nr:hypothetical protein [Chloroflexota bacterium]
MTYYPAEVQLTPLTTVRRERMLPAPGEILVAMGDHVDPQQVVARVNLPGDFRIIPVARLLDLSSAQVKGCMRVKPGEEVKQGQVIAKRGRLFSRVVTSPIDGIVTAVGGGRALIETHVDPFELQAYIPGTVTNVLAPHGLIIETTGAVVQGMWGAGGDGWGVLKCVVERPDQPLQASDIDPSCHGTIVIGGCGLNEAVLEQARELNVRGVVVGGVSPALLAQIERWPCPIVATEGIGELAMAEPIFRLLTTNDGREAAIRGVVQPRWPMIRPEIVIPLPAGAVKPSQNQPRTPLTVGTRVRVVHEPYQSAIGTIKTLPGQPRVIETGARVLGAEVDLGQGTPIFVPLVNLEVLR